VNIEWIERKTIERLAKQFLDLEVFVMIVGEAFAYRFGYLSCLYNSRLSVL
jgi:hypothetical protein